MALLPSTWGGRATSARGPVRILRPEEGSAADWYRMMLDYYKNNGLYEDLKYLDQETLTSESSYRLKALRNPAYRVVEFYASKLWPGVLPDALPIVTKKTAIIKPIQQIWQWSNFNQKKAVASRFLPIYGDLFIKVAMNAATTKAAQRVYLQLDEGMEPQYVTDFDKDERGFLTYIRIDTPQTRRDADGKKQGYTRTEIWTKEAVRIWEHDHGTSTTKEYLGDPILIQPLAMWGIDFIPIVHAKFRDIGEMRGVGAYALQIDKIDEANKMATRLHQMFFRYGKATWIATQSGFDKDGRPIPAVRISGSGMVETDAVMDTEAMTLRDNEIIRMAGGQDMKQLVPNIDYSAGLDILSSMMDELKYDLPELAYYDIRSMNQISGIAIRLLLDDALSKLEEARGNAEQALIRANMMALSIGANAGLFSDIGRYEDGDFEHSFAARDFLPVSDKDRADTAKAYVDAGVPLKAALRRGADWTEPEIEQIEKDIDEDTRTQRERNKLALEADRMATLGAQPAIGEMPSVNGNGAR